jgi:hypothetical protein
VIDEKLLLEPSAANLADFNKQLPKELLDPIEPIDPTDGQSQYIINGERRQQIGNRIFDHYDWRGRKYYRYLEAVGRASVSNVDLEKIIAYLLCVAAIGIILLLAMLPGGQVRFFS